MSERPFMQLYVSDFVGDTLLLSTEHIGAYLLLLIALWNADGQLPSDEMKLARVARVSVKRWRKIAVDLLPFFQVSEGVLTHHRLTKELQKSVAQSISRASAGARGGIATALKYNGSVPANAAAVAAAGLQHASASPKPYRKEGQSSISEEGAIAPNSDGLVVAGPGEPEFEAVAKLRGKPPIIGKSGRSTFTRAEVDQALAALREPSPRSRTAASETA